MKKILLFVAGLMLAMSASAGVYLRGNGDWDSLDKEFTDNGDGTYTLTAEFELSESFKIADEGYSTINYGTGGEAAKVGTIPVEANQYNNIAVTSIINVTKMILDTNASTLTIEGTQGGEIVFDGTYYIAGESESSDFVCGLKWDPKGCPLTNGTVTYTALPAGEYKFKITNGTWDQSWGLAQLPDPTAYPANDDNNVIFTLEAASDVTISFDGTTLSLTINGEGGDDNTGDDNTGDDNTGDDNTGDDNTGDDNTGDDNTGDDNTGDIPTTGFSIQVNGSALYAFTDEGAWDQDPTFNQLSLKGVALKAGDTFVFYNNENGATWANVLVDEYSVDGINGTGEVFEVTLDGCYDIYLKLKYEADNVYFGASDNCQETPTDLEDVDAEDAVVAAYDLLGRPVAADAAGYVILQYASGKAVKVFNN